jgi:hypothetical protein
VDFAENLIQTEILVLNDILAGLKKKLLSGENKEDDFGINKEPPYLQPDHFLLL